MYYYIVNPAAGNGKINKIQNKLKETVKTLGINGEFVKTTGQGDVPKLVEMALGKSQNTIIAVGGDSTVNEVTNVLVDQKATLGVIPTGNTNSLAKTLGINSWEEACQILAARKLEKIDLAKIISIPETPSQKIKERYFITSAEIGFESNIAKYRTEDRFIYKIIFAKNVLSQLLRVSEQKVTIEVNDSFTATTQMLTLIVANCRFSKNNQGNNCKFVPNPQDRLLDILIVSKMARFKLLNSLSTIINGSYENLSETSVFKAKNVKIITKEPMNLSVDGEMIAKTPVEIEIDSAKLKVIVGKQRTF
jgi:YegS/Rv2252/BmrU family lipid kinase